MFSHDAGDIDKMVAKICKDKLQCRQVKDHCLNFLNNVEVPFGWKDESYKLNQDLPTYKYRLQILKAFVTVAKKEGRRLCICNKFYMRRIL